MNGKENTASDSPSGAGGNTQRDLALELYKLEYERAAIRYEDIYKAVWQIFSYMTAISGALLAFGGDHFQENLFWFLASTPLIYWFWSTYVPLDSYGRDIGTRLSGIEEQLNGRYGVDLRHYRHFEQRTSKASPFRLRVRHVVLPVFLLLSCFSAYQVYRAVSARLSGVPMLREKATEVKIVTIDTEELRKLIEKAKGASQTPALPDTKSQRGAN
ncbi:MAG: hypothetical protein WAN12_13315 [Candidatus Acidiferrum sp.]